MVVSLLEHIVYLLNSFSTKNSVSNTISPATIVEGSPKLDLSQNRLPFGAYAQVWIGTKNNMTERAVPGIALQASNSKGGFYFMSLYTGKRLNSYVWEELPISDEVIERVEELAEQQKQPDLINGIPTFEWTPHTQRVEHEDRDEEQDNTQRVENEDRDEQQDNQSTDHYE